MSTLGRRMLTGIIFVTVMTAGIYVSAYTFIILFGLIAGLCLWEFLGLALDVQGRKGLFRRIMGTAIGLAPFIIIAGLCLNAAETPYIYAKGFSILFVAFFAMMLFELFAKSENPFRNIAYSALGLIYIGAPFAMMVLVSFQSGSYLPNIMMSLLLLSWANDSGAYGVGSRFGKTPLAPHISPKKTWEGAIGGVVITIITALICSQYITEFSLVDWLVLSLIIVTLGSLGDLTESMFKRNMQVKDSGKLLPGHGGLLDRFDGLIFIMPFVSAYIYWIKN